MRSSQFVVIERTTRMPNAHNDAGGRLLWISDAWFDDVALTLEINSYAWHPHLLSTARS